MSRRVRLATALSVASVGLPLVACGGDEDQIQAPNAAQGDDGATTTYVGRVEGSSAYVALVADGTRLSGYVCDGRRVSRWFEDTSFDRGSAEFETRDGREIGEASLEAGAASGEIEVDGARRRFAAEAAGGAAGLYRDAKGEPGSPGYRETGWIVLNDGSVKGALNLGDGSVRSINDGTSNTNSPKGKVTGFIDPTSDL